MYKTSIVPLLQPLINMWRGWWRKQTPNRQDRFAFMAPLAAVVLFMAAITTAFWYLRYEELDREQEVVRRDVEYAQQRIRLRLLDKQEQVMRLARDITDGETRKNTFNAEARAVLIQSLEMASLTWVDPMLRVQATFATPSSNTTLAIAPGQVITRSETMHTFQLARELQQPVYSHPVLEKNPTKTAYAYLQLHVPMYNRGKFQGVLIAEYSMEGMLRFAVPAEVADRYAVSLRDASNLVLAGQANTSKPKVTEVLPWLFRSNEYEVPITPVGYDLSLHAQAYRTSTGLVGNGVFWLVVVLSTMTAWMLIGTWRHTRRRVQVQQALIAETNFRRAMENSILTGMRAMDLKGRITYVNAAFCQMTGWTEDDLVGRVPLFP